jgi:hypothetical protein
MNQIESGGVPDDFQLSAGSLRKTRKRFHHPLSARINAHGYS